MHNPPEYRERGEYFARLELVWTLLRHTPRRILTCDMRTDELDFDLPPELIAQEPPPQRHSSRLLHYRRSDGSVLHRTFSDLSAILTPGDLLVFNNARVLPARFMLRKETGGKVEGLFL